MMQLLMSRSSRLALTCLTLLPAVCRAQQQQPPAAAVATDADCFTSSSVVGAVLGTFFATAIVLAVLVFILWWIYYRRLPSSTNDGGRQTKAAASSGAVESGGSGFDNPCFDSDVADAGATKADNAGRNKDGAKSTSWTPLRFFGTRSEKKRSLDDSFVSEPERVSVQLRGHDFTGLGFNVTGNMRDGIYVKDILNRGPASESGKIAQGDKILSVTICFRHVVYEDALTILSYASPYDVTLELEKNPPGRTNTLLKQRKTAGSSVSLMHPSSSVQIGGGISASTSGIGGVAQFGGGGETPVNERLVHPLYRSQSIDDLSKVGRADTAIRANVRIPTLSATVGGGGGYALHKSKLLTKANLEVDAPDIKLKTAKMPSMSAAVSGGASNISISPPDASMAIEPGKASVGSKFSKFGIKVLPDIKFNKGGAKGSAAIAASGDVPQLQLNAPKSSDMAINIDMPDGPSFNLPSGDVSVAIDMPEVPNVQPLSAGGDVTLDIDAPMMSLSSADVGVSLPKNVELGVDAKMPKTDVSLDLGGTKDIKASSGFHMKFPKFGGGGGKTNIKAEIPDAEIGVVAPSVDVNLPDIDLQGPKEKKDSKTGFEFKMPKMNLRKTSKPEGSVDISAALPDIKVPDAEVSVEIPKASIEMETPSMSASLPAVEVEVPSVSVEAKKPKMGFSMPKWSLGGKGGVDLKEPTAELSVEAPSVQVEMPQVTLLSDDDDTEGGKKKSKFSLKMPKMPKAGVKGDVDVNVALPKVSAEVKVDAEDEGTKKKGGKFSLKMPKMPKGEADVNLGLPKVGGDVNLVGGADLDLATSGVDVNLELPKISAEVQQGDADISIKKKGGMFGLKMPKMPKADLDVNLSLPKVSAEMKHDDDSDDGEDTDKKKSSKFGLGFKKPKLPKGDVDVKLDLPKVSGDVALNLPSSGVDVNLDLPKISAEVEQESDDDADASKSKKSSKFGLGLKMPKMPKGEFDINLDLPKVSAGLEHENSADETDGDGSTKKGKFGLKMPKFLKGDMDVNLSLPNISAEAEVNKHGGDSDIDSKQKNFGIKLPRGEVDVNLDLPTVSADVALGEANLDLTSAEVDVNLELPKISTEVQQGDADISIKKKGGMFGLQMPKMPKGDVDVNLALPKVSAEVKHGDDSDSDADTSDKKAGGKFALNVPKLPKGDVDVNLSLPKVSAEMKHESDSEDDADASNSKKKPSKFGLGLKMPKMPKGEVDVNLAIPKVSAEVKHDGDSDDDVETSSKKTSGKLNFKMPKLPEGDVDVNLSLPKVSAEVKHDDDSEDDTGALTSKKKSSKFGLGLKMPKMPKGEVDVNLALPKVSAEVKHDGDSDDGEDAGKKKSSKFGLKMPKLPKGDVDVNLALPKVTADVKHDDESGDDEASPKKKSSKFGLKMPKLPKGEVDVNLSLPKASVEVKHDGHSDDEESSPKKKSTKFGLKMPKMSKGEVDVDLAVPKVNAEFDVEGHSDNEGASKKKSTKFGLKMPKMPRGDVDVNLALQKVSTEVKNDGESDDEASVGGVNKKKSSKFSLKMPKWSVNKPQSELQLEGIEGRIQMGTEIADLAPSAEMRMSDIGSDEDEEGGRKRSKFAIKMPKFGMSKPHFQADVSVPEVSADVESPKLVLEAGAESDVKKKGSKFGFKMPKMSGSAALPDADLHLEASKDINVELPKVDVKVTSESSADEEEADPAEKNKKKKRFHLKMPKFGTPKAQVDVELPSVDVGGASLDVNLPKIKPIDASMDIPKVNLEVGSSGTAATTDTEDDDHEGAKKKTNKFSLKMPKLGFSKPSADVNLGMDVGGDIDLVASKEDDSADEATKKKIGIKLPKLGWSSGGDGKMGQADVDLEEGASVNLDTGVHLDTSGMNLPHDIDIDLGFEEKKKGTKFGIKLPGLHLDKPHPDTSVEADLSDEEGGDTKKKSKLSVKLPKFSLSKHQPELKAGVDLPDIKVEGDLKQPNIDLKVDLSDDEDEESKKSSGKIGFKMPKFHMKKKTPDVEIDLDKEVSIGLDLDETRCNTDDDDSSDDENHDKKRGKFGMKMPKFGFKKPQLEVELPAGKTNLSVEGELDATKVQVDIPNVSVDGDDRLFSVNLPDVSVGKPQLDFNFDASAVSTALTDIPSLDLKGELPNVAVTDMQLSTDIEIPKLPTMEVEGMKKKSKFGIDMGKMGFNKPSVDVKVGAGTDLSKEVKIELPKVELDHDIDEMDEEKRKGSKFSFKMPKFHMGKQHGEITIPKVDVPDKLEAELNVQPSSPSLEVEVPKISLDLHGKEDAADSDDEKKDGTKKKSRFGIKMPKFHMNKPSAPGLGLDVKSEDVAGGLDVKMNLPTLEGNIQGLSTFVEDFEAGGKEGGLEMTLPKVAVNPVDLEVNLPDIKSDVLEKEGKKKGKFSFKMPKLHMGGKTGQTDIEAPSTEINLNLPNLELALPENTTRLEKPTIDKPSLDLDVEGGANISLPAASLQLGASAPQIGLPEVELPKIDVKLDANSENTSKQSPFIVKMPDFNLMKPKVDLEGPKLRLGEESDDSTDSDDEREDKKAFKLGFKMPQFAMEGKGDANLELESPSLSVDVTAPSVEVPSVSASAILPEVTVVEGKKKSKFGFKMPSMPSGKIQAEVPGFELPNVGVEIQPPEIEKEINVKMPKFQMRQRGPDVVLPQVELKADEHFEAEAAGSRELKVEVKKPKFGIKLPTLEFNKPKLEVEIPKKELDVELATGAIEFNLERPQVELEMPQPALNVDASSIDVQVGNIDVEVARVKAQLEQLQAEYDIQSGKQQLKIKKPNSSADSDEDEKSKSSGFNLGLKMPKFSLGKDKTDIAEAKFDVDMPSLSVGVKSNGDELVSPSFSSLEAEPIKLESSVSGEKEKKKFNLGIKMPKFQSKAATVGVEGDAGLNADPVSVEPKHLKVNLKAPKVKERKKKSKEGHHSNDHSGDEENGDNDDSKIKELSASASSKLMDVEVKLPRVQVYKNVEYHDAEREHHESSSDEEDEVKDIKKNIGARFGVKLKKPKMFSSSKVDITSKNEPANASALQPEWKLPRVDLRRTSKSMDQELSVDVDLDIDHHRLEQMSPSERAEAIRRDSKSSTGMRLHSPSYISPRSKKSSLEMLDVESSPRLLSVTRLDPTPPIESSAMTQPTYGNVQLTASLTGPQVSVSDVPSSVIMASDAVKLKRGPPIPARRSIVDANSSVFRVNLPINTTDVTVGDLVSPIMSGEVSITSEVEANLGESIYVSGHQPQQASDTDISVTTSTGSDMLVITCASSSSANAQDAPNRKASSLGDLTRIPTTGSEDGSLERTVSLDFKPVATSAGSSSRAIYNLAVQDLSRVGEDSDEDYSMNRKRSASNYENLEIDTTLSATMVESPSSPSGGDSNVTVNRPTVAKRTLLAVDTDGDGDVSIRPLDADSAEALWFGSTSIQTVESVQTNMSYGQLEESISTDVTLTTTSLGTSPSETSSSSSDDSPAFPASPEPNSDNSPDLMTPNFQVENGSSKQYHTEMIEITHEEFAISSSTTRTITMEITSPDDPQPQPLTDLNPSAGSFAAVRNRFEQLSGTSGIALNGAETTVVQNRNSSPRLSQGNVVKRLSGNFEDPPSKSYIQPMVPELSEGALSRTVIISSLQLERSEQSSSGPTTSVGPESPVPNLEPPC